MKLLKTITPHFLYIVIIIAALILLKRCGNDRDSYQQQAAIADSLRNAAQHDAATQRQQLWEYRNDTATYRFQTRQWAKRADSIQRVTRSQSAEIRQLYAELGKPWPVDTVKIGTECCSLAVHMADSYDSLRMVDSLKDGSYVAQIDLATIRIDTLQNQLDRSNNRFQILDSLNRVVMQQAKPRGSVWVGAGGMVGPVSSSGVYVKYQGQRKEYSIGAGMQPGGWYVEGKVGIKISFKKR